MSNTLLSFFIASFLFVIGRPKPRKKIVTRTLRLYEEVDRGLSDFAEKRNLSVSAIANSFLQRIVELEALSERVRSVTVQARLLTKILETVSDPTVEELGRWSGANTYWGTRLPRNNSLPELLDNLAYHGSHSRLYKIDYFPDERTYRMILTHDLGPKWSIFYESFLRRRFEDLGTVSLIVRRRTEAEIVAEIGVPLVERGVAAE